LNSKSGKPAFDKAAHEVLEKNVHRNIVAGPFNFLPKAVAGIELAIVGIQRH
jgi:hypothetical protein